MSNNNLVREALHNLSSNKEQYTAATSRNHCVVLAGPGSGKTKTLTTSMARVLYEEVKEPRGVACITYSNECAIELEERLAKLGIERNPRVFIGTVHSFALTQIILPYGRCVLPAWNVGLKVATKSQIDDAIRAAHAEAIGGNDNPINRWKFATEKRKRVVDRRDHEWRGKNIELTNFIEAYEAQLRAKGLIDFDDMPLLAYSMLINHPWICNALRAKFPVFFVDEYQDLGHALHKLVLKLCFDTGIRLFAVGDADQSIYGFNGAEPALLNSLASRKDVDKVTLKFNYRCGTNIIDASMAALGEERGYVAPEGASRGEIHFHGIDGNDEALAKYTLETLVPSIQKNGLELDEIGILYRWAKHSTALVKHAKVIGIPLVRADNQALVKRGSSIGRFLIRCAEWVTGGWKIGAPRFQRLSRDATSFVYGSLFSETERQELERELIKFLTPVDGSLSAHEWLTSMRRELIAGWRVRARTVGEAWDDLDEIIARTDPGLHEGNDLSLSFFCGDTSGTGALNLSTFHSSKGREFRAVILLGMNAGVIPLSWNLNKPKKLREERREFYVAVTRAKEDLHLTFQKGNHSTFVYELHQRISAGS